ncbi:MAG TPA: serine/threonine-protein kinase [Polyangia bacterium]|nr:serine/threonine-protein kinase [Polyangia bacterium]
MERIGQVLVETYRVERLIAEGGMAYVFEASHLRIPKRFAVKFLKLSLVNNSEALLRFRREAEIIATLEHPNIVNLVDYNVSDDNTPYIVMEFLDGEHLGKRLERGKLPLGEALRIARAVASALSAAHAREIIHRDLKPENIILCKGDVVKVVDFGVAKLRGAPELTAFNTILGTVAYMAPEQVTAKAVDSRTDQYALGVIIHELLSGTQPSGTAQSVAEQAMKILYGQLPPVEGVQPKVNEALFRAMAKNPFERYASVSEFIDALLDAAQPLAAPAPAPAPAPAAAAPVDELPELPGEATSITTSPPVRDSDRDEESRETDAPEPLNGVHVAPTAELDAAQIVPPSQRATLLMGTVSAPPPPPFDPNTTLQTDEASRTTLPPISNEDDLRPLPGVRPIPSGATATTLPPHTNVRDVLAIPEETDRRPLASTMRGGVLPLWAWFAIGLAASGGLVTAFWALALRR